MIHCSASERQDESDAIGADNPSVGYCAVVGTGIATGSCSNGGGGGDGDVVAGGDYYAPDDLIMDSAADAIVEDIDRPGNRQDWPDLRSRSYWLDGHWLQMLGLFLLPLGV